MNGLTEIYQPVSEEIETVKNIVKTRVAAMAEIRPYIEPYFNHEAKYMRPFLALMSAKMASNGRIAGRTMNRLCDFAAAVELIHTASLVHDDILDGELKRRGQASINSRYGPQSAVLLGDILYTEALQALAGSFKAPVLEKLLETVSKMCLGQLLEKTDNVHDRQAYLNLVKLKTGLLMGFSCAAISCADNKFNNVEFTGRLYNFGVSAGIFYQLVDDAVDKDSGTVITDDDIASAKSLAANELKIFPPSIYKTGLLEFLDYIERYKNEFAALLV